MIRIEEQKRQIDELKDALKNAHSPARKNDLNRRIRKLSRELRQAQMYLAEYERRKANA